MKPPTDCREFLDLLQQSAVLPAERLESYMRSRRALWKNLTQSEDAAKQLLADGILSRFQVKQLLHGKYRGFWINKYLILESLASGGMGQVVLCEQTPMSRLVALKVLPGKEPGDLERFMREARAVAALDHPNIVRAIDIDHEARFHFLVMEYVDGTNLHDLVAEHGRLEVPRACYYIAQAALGLQHAHEAGWVHRDIKPGNLLVERSGVVKILDLGLARLTTDEKDNLTKRIDEHAIMGTADFLAPEQSLPGQIVDGRADIYSLGNTLYFLLTGKAPFGQGSVVQKIMAHQMQKPRSIRLHRSGLPKDLITLIERMMDKSPARRPQTAREVAEILTGFVPEGDYSLKPGEYVEHCPRVRQLLLAKAPKTTPLPISAEKLSADAKPARANPKQPKSDPKPMPQAGKKNRPTPQARRRFLPIVLLGGGAAVLLVLAALGGGWWLLSRWFGPVIVNPRPDLALKDKDKEKDKDKGKGKDKHETIVIPGVLAPEEALKNLNNTCTVEMVVRSTGLSKDQKMLFLNSEADFKAKNNLTVVVKKLGVGDDLQKHFRDKKIRVSGQVTLYNDQKQIVVEEPPSIVVPGVLSAEEALKNVNNICTVEMVVCSTGMSKNQKKLFLNSDPDFKAKTNFTVVVEKLDRVPGIGDDVQAHFRDKTIRVSGQVTLYNDQKQIIVEDLQKITVVKK